VSLASRTLCAGSVVRPLSNHLPGGIARRRTLEELVAAPSTLEIPVEEKQLREVNQQVVVPGLGTVTSTWGLAGPSTTVAKKVNFVGLQLSSANSAIVMTQARQSANQDHNYPDGFAVQVVSVTPHSVLCLIRRVDAASGWAQNLRIDLLVIDQLLNP
jgi:hypothetical protein